MRLARWWALVLLAAWWPSAVPAETVTVPAEQSFDRQAFEYRIEPVESTAEYDLFRLTYPSEEALSWPEAARVAAYYYRPAGIAGTAPRPGVVCLHILGGDGELTRMIAANFAANGIPAIMPIFPLFGERVPAGGRNAAVAGPGGARLIGESFRAVPGEVRRAADILQSFPEVNPERIDIMGTSLGGIMAATVAGLDGRFDRAVFLLAGGDFGSLLENRTKEIDPMREARERASAADREFFDAVVGRIDPLAHAANLRKMAGEGRIMMFNAGNDEVIPRANTEKLAEALGMAGRVEYMPGLGHYSAIASLPGLMNGMVEFFRDDTVPVRTAAREVAPDKEVIKRIFAELGLLLSGTPEPGSEMEVAGNVEVTAGGMTYAGNFRFARGEGERFALRCSAPGSPLPVTALDAGIGDWPWMTSGKGMVFRGRLEPSGDGVFAENLDGKLAMFSRMASSVARLVAMTGDLGPLEKWVTLELVNRPDRLPAILIREKKVTAEIELDASASRPLAIRIDAGKWRAAIRFTEWEIRSTPDPARFMPPADAPATREVSGRELARTMAAAINFALKEVKL